MVQALRRLPADEGGGGQHLLPPTSRARLPARSAHVPIALPARRVLARLLRIRRAGGAGEGHRGARACSARQHTFRRSRDAVPMTHRGRPPTCSYPGRTGSASTMLGALPSSHPVRRSADVGCAHARRARHRRRASRSSGRATRELLYKGANRGSRMGRLRFPTAAAWSNGTWSPTGARLNMFRNATFTAETSTTSVCATASSGARLFDRCRSSPSPW